MDGNEETRLLRWSRLKRGEGVEEPTTIPETAEPPSEEPQMLTEADLPDIEGLDKGSDFTAFLKENVPHHLHRLALRKLWKSDPVMANLDGLNDYDLDYTIKEAMEVAVQSAEDLARGSRRLNISDLRAKEREQRERERAARLLSEKRHVPVESETPAATEEAEATDIDPAPEPTRH